MPKGSYKSRANRIDNYGSASNAVKAVTVKYGDMRFTYVSENGGKLYRDDGIQKQLQEVDGIDFKTMLKRVRDNPEVTIEKEYSAKEWNKEYSAREEANRNRPDYELGVGMEDNKQYRKSARSNRLINRVQKRKR